jgi:hypothetical protein
MDPDPVGKELGDQEMSRGKRRSSSRPRWPISGTDCCVP